MWAKIRNAIIWIAVGVLGAVAVVIAVGDRRAGHRVRELAGRMRKTIGSSSERERAADRRDRAISELDAETKRVEQQRDELDRNAAGTIDRSRRSAESDRDFIRRVRERRAQSSGNNNSE